MLPERSSRRFVASADDFTTPEDACPTFHAFYDGLKEFEQDLHQHIHLENNILFPRAIELERSAFECGSIQH